LILSPSRKKRLNPWRTEARVQRAPWFQKLRFAFLCMEHNPLGDETRHYLSAMATIFQSTQDWVQSKQ